MSQGPTFVRKPPSFLLPAKPDLRDRTTPEYLDQGQAIHAASLAGEAGIRWIDLDQLDYASTIPRQPSDAIDLFAFVSLEMPNPAGIRPLAVRFDHCSGKYLLLAAGPAYTSEGLPLEGARLLGLSKLPCRVVSDNLLPASTMQDFHPDSAVPSVNDRQIPDPTRLESLFRDLLLPLTHMARSGRRRTTAAALRIADDDDWLQEALLALWRELTERDEPRLTTAEAVRRFVFGVLRNQGARAGRLGGRICPLSDDCAHSCRPAPDELVAAEEDRQLDADVAELQALIVRASEALDDTLCRLPPQETMAAEAMLEGISLRKAAADSGLTLAQIRRVVLQLRFGPATSLLRQAHRELGALYRRCPSAVGRLNLEPFTRLLSLWKKNSQRGSGLSRAHKRAPPT